MKKKNKEYYKLQILKMQMLNLTAIRTLQS